MRPRRSDARLVSEVLRIFLAEIFASTRLRASKRRRVPRASCGAVLFIQRFGGSVNLNVHLHTLALDGVYVSDDPGEVRFRPVPPPGDGEVARVTMRVARRIAKLLDRRGLGAPLLAALYSSSIRGTVVGGPRTGRKVTRFGDRIAVEDIAVHAGPRCATVSGFSVHANVAVPARDRKRLERLCRYVARPPVATERLSLLPDGRVAYTLKNPYRDGTTHVVFEPLDFVAKLAALVPPPRVNLVRYHGLCGAPHITACSRPRRG